MTEIEREVRLKALRDAMGEYVSRLMGYAGDAEGDYGEIQVFEAARMCEAAMELGGETIGMARDRLGKAVEPLRHVGYCYVIPYMERVLDELEKLDREHPIAEGCE